MKEKNLELERLVFFSDAIVAIAITLLALELKIESTGTGHITFADFYHSWHKFAAFFLSFFIIALFWRIHHQFFMHIKAVNVTLMWFNIVWLMFIVLLPFTSSLISNYFFDKAAMFSYCFNVFIITIFQNNIWDYCAVRPDFLKEKVSDDVIRDYRVSCNVAMVNALLASIIAFISPVIAFIILFTRLPMIFTARRISKMRRR